MLIDYDLAFIDRVGDSSSESIIFYLYRLFYGIFLLVIQLIIKVQLNDRAIPIRKNNILGIFLFGFSNQCCMALYLSTLICSITAD